MENGAPIQKVDEIAFGPWDLVLALAWSADGRRLAAAAGEDVHIYDAGSLEEVQVLEVGAWVDSLVFITQENGNGYFLGLAAKDGSIQVWEAAGGGRLLCRFAGHTRGANSVAYSKKDGLLASTGNDGYVRLWEVTPAIGGEDCPTAPAAEMIGGAFAVSAVEFSPDGALVASASDQLIHLREPGSQRLVRTLFGEAPIFSLAFSPDGKWLASAEPGGRARLWQVETGEPFTLLEPPSDRPGRSGAFLWSVAFSPDGSLLAGGRSDGDLLLWDLRQQPPRAAAMTAHARAATSLAFNPTGEAGLRLATGGLDGVLAIWAIP